MSTQQRTNHDDGAAVQRGQKKQELKLFVFIVVVLFPLASVAIIGAYGLVIWLLQIMAGH